MVVFVQDSGHAKHSAEEGSRTRDEAIASNLIPFSFLLFNNASVVAYRCSTSNIPLKSDIQFVLTALQ